MSVISHAMCCFVLCSLCVLVYCGREWPDIFGSNFTAFSDVPLIYAHYDNVPSFYDFNPYGGWDKPSGKQFWDGAQGEVRLSLRGSRWFTGMYLTLKWVSHDDSLAWLAEHLRLWCPGLGLVSCSVLVTHTYRRLCPLCGFCGTLCCR